VQKNFGAHPLRGGNGVEWIMFIDGLTIISKPVKFCDSGFNHFCVEMGYV